MIYLLLPKSCFLLIMLVLRKRIQLVCMLFKEAGKAIGAIPMLLLQPIIVSKTTYLLIITIIIIIFSQKSTTVHQWWPFIRFLNRKNRPLQTLSILSAIGFGWLIGTLFLMSNRQPVVDSRTGFVVYTFNSIYKVKTNCFRIEPI